MTDGQFEQFVDDGFRPPAKRKGGQQPEPLSDDVRNALEREGADPRLTKSQARFSAALSRCLRQPVHPLSDESVTFLKEFDEAMRTVVEAADIKLFED